MSQPIYHITHIDNLTSILNKGLIAKNFQNNLNYRDIAYQNIQYRRNYTQVPCGAGGSLHDYVPFYFCPRSPMLYTRYMQGDQKSILHLVVDAEEIDNCRLEYVFTDGHATMNYTEFFDDIVPLIHLDDDLIDWETINSRYWFNT